jgi:hypothetical protein
VALGSALVVGADGEANGSSGAAYVFSLVNSTWSQQQKLVPSDNAAGDDFGSAVGIQSSTLIVGASQATNGLSGKAYVYNFNSTSGWLQGPELSAPDGKAGDRFGASVAISGIRIPGSLLAVGAFDHTNTGAWYAFGAPTPPATPAIGSFGPALLALLLLAGLHAIHARSRGSEGRPPGRLKNGTPRPAFPTTSKRVRAFAEGGSR